MLQVMVTRAVAFWQTDYGRRVDTVEQRVAAGSSTGVCRDVATCRGPRTDAAGLTDTTWPVTSQSNK
jgi:hypothetical protein